MEVHDKKEIERMLGRCFLVVLSLACTLATLEVASRCYLWYWADETFFAKYASLNQLFERRESTRSSVAALQRKATNTNKYSPHRYLGYRGASNYVKGKNRHNRLGYRGEEIAHPKPKGRFRIVCLGGSTTYTAEVEDYKLSYPYLLEKHLRDRGAANIDVVNAGLNGWSSWETLINLQFRVLDLDPDLIIFYGGINDIHARLVWPPESYQGDNSGRREPDQSSLLMPGILEYSTLLRMLLIRGGMVTPHLAFERTIDRTPPTYHGNEFARQVEEGTYPEGIFAAISGERMLAINQPVYFARNIRNMIAVAKAHDVIVVISSFAYSTVFSEEPRVSSPEYIEAHDENNDLLRQIAESCGVRFFDFASVFPTERRFYADGRHVNEAGSRLKAQLFGDYLLEEQLVAISQH